MEPLTEKFMRYAFKEDFLLAQRIPNYSLLSHSVSQQLGRSDPPSLIISPSLSVLSKSGIVIKLSGENAYALDRTNMTCCNYRISLAKVPFFVNYY